MWSSHSFRMSSRSCSAGVGFAAASGARRHRHAVTSEILEALIGTSLQRAYRVRRLGASAGGQTVARAEGKSGLRLALWLAPLLLASQLHAERPHVFALTHATVVTQPGKSI